MLALLKTLPAEVEHLIVELVKELIDSTIKYPRSAFICREFKYSLFGKYDYKVTRLVIDYMEKYDYSTVDQLKYFYEPNWDVAWCFVYYSPETSLTIHEFITVFIELHEFEKKVAQDLLWLEDDIIDILQEK